MIHGPYRTSNYIFLKLMGIVYAVAFASLGVQILGLIGSEGIAPVEKYLELIASRFGAEKFYHFPTLAWLGATDSLLLIYCWGGFVVALLLIVGFFPIFCLTLLWILYLSLVYVGQNFLSFQWDMLLLEAGFLAIFFAPVCFYHRLSDKFEPSKWILWMFRILLFRLMFSSGMVKLLSGDPSWRDLTALTVHYETTPLPVWLGWYFHQLPVLFHKISTAVMFFIELAVPFLIFCGRRARFVCFIAQIGLQILIMLTGNYAFFNILTMALCLSLLDDQSWPLNLFKSSKAEQEERSLNPGLSRRVISISIASLLLVLNVVQLNQTLGSPLTVVPQIKSFQRAFQPFRLVSGYGLFANMTMERPEIIFEGSRDGKVWKPYEFRWKPGSLEQRPNYVEPHQPRLDWQMWFAALGGIRRNPWVLGFMKQTITGAEPVLKLLKHNPFPNDPPNYLRATLFDYRFTSASERKLSGHWWKRSPKGLFSPVMARRGKTVFFMS